MINYINDKRLKLIDIGRNGHKKLEKNED